MQNKQEVIKIQELGKVSKLTLGYSWDNVKEINKPGQRTSWE